MATQRRKRLAALALLLLTLCAGTALAQGEVVSGTTISGTVRVYLSSIASNTSVDVSVDGSYSIGGDASRAIARGTRLNVRNSGGTLLLTMNGQTQTMGSRFKLRRHQTTGENGVRIAQARYPGSLYPGDVEFIANGGNVQIVVHVYMEDYMRGVLPYEMDNSFPLEALKAQAVAARTYALKKMSAQAATYDVVDTTSDQVYNGTPTGNARCAQAVEETSGIVGTVGGEYMASYYTASNGGQTESVANAWGSGSYSYLQVKDDPYDLRNPASVAKSVTFYRDGTTSVSALTALLRTEAAALVGAQSVSIEAITRVTPHTPRYGAPSRVYQKLDVGLRLTGYGEVTVTLDYFSQVEGLCGLSINVLKNETLDVTETVGGYRLTARRYGHGVGMSQRGAQQMASEGMTYDQILEFYYPGLTRTKYTMTRTILPTLDGTQQETPQEPVTDAKTAVVTLKNPLDSLNLRREPGLSAPILATMPHGTQVTLLEQGDWCRVQYGTLSGYVKGEYLRVQEDEVEETPPAAQTRGTATVALSDVSQTLNLRAAPTLGSVVLARLRHGQVLTVLERYESWTYVQSGTLEGYVSNDYIIYDADGGVVQPEQPPQTGEEGAQTAIVLPSDGLNLRVQPSRTSGVIMTLPQGTMLTVTGEAVGDMLPVALGDLKGYVACEYVFVPDEVLVTPTPAPEAGGAQEPGQDTPQGVRYATVTASGGLKLREEPHTGARTLTTMPMGSTVEVTGEETNGFYPVRYGSMIGYAGAAYLNPGAQGTPIPVPTATPAPTPAPGSDAAGRTGTVAATSGLNLRAEPSASAQVLATLGYGVSVTVTGEAVSGFYPVRVGTLAGYVSADYVRLEGQAAAPTAAPTPTAQPTSAPESAQESAYRVVVESGNGLNLRARPDTASEVLYVLPYGMVLTVLGEAENGFLHVTWAGYEGYVSGAYVAPFGAQGGE